MSGISFKVSESRLKKVLKGHEEVALRYFWDEGYERGTTRQVYDYVSGVLGTGSVSRATIINFLKRMGEEGVLSVWEEPGKGGHRRVYGQRMDEEGFRKHMLRTVIDSMMDDYPDETRKVMNEYR
jgi:predicted transcriptional regulator